MKELDVKLTPDEINLLFDSVSFHKNQIFGRADEEPKLSLNKIFIKLNKCLKDSGYYNEENKMRREIAENCRESINSEIEIAQMMCRPISLTIERILKIIRGE